MISWLLTLALGYGNTTVPEKNLTSKNFFGGFTQQKLITQIIFIMNNYNFKSLYRSSL